MSPMLNADASVLNPMVLAELTVYDPAIAATRTLYLSDRRDFRTKSTDTPASVSYLGRIRNPGTISVDVIAAWAKGLALFGIGELEFVNTDGALDGWNRYVFDGYPITLYFGTISFSGALTRTKLFTGTMEQPDVGKRAVHLPVRTPMYGLDKPILSTTFAGTGGTNPPEGDATIKGRIKPRLYGYASNMPLIPVDAANNVYFLCDRSAAITSLQIYDSGLPLTEQNGGGAVGEYANLAALYAAVIASGSFGYAFHASGTYVRLNSLPAGQLTGNAADLYYNTAALDGNITGLLTDAGNAVTRVILDVYYPLLGAYPNICDAPVGAYVSDQRSYADVIAKLLPAVGGWLWYGAATDKSTTPARDTWIVSNFSDDDTLYGVGAVIEDSQIIDMTKLGNPKTPGEGIPPFQITYGYGENYTVQASGLAATVDANRRAYLASQQQQRTHKNAAVLNTYPLAQAIDFSGNLTYGEDSLAQDIVDKLFTALGLAPDFYRVRVKLTRALVTFVPTTFVAGILGGPWQWLPCMMPTLISTGLGIKTPRFGFLNTAKGTKCGVMAVSLDLAAKEVTYVVWTTYRAG